MSTNFGWGRNGKFCDAVGPVSRTAGYASLNGFISLPAQSAIGMSSSHTAFGLCEFFFFFFLKLVPNYTAW